jgi:RHS repeat-associated protein
MKSPVRSVQSRLPKSSIKSANIRPQGWKVKVISLFLLLNFLIWPSSGFAKDFEAASTVVVASTITLTTGSFRTISYLFRHLFSSGRRQARQRETTADRNAQVSSIRINPARIVGYVGQKIQFSAIGSNAAGLTIQGVQFGWNSSDQEKLQIDSSGSATLTAAGVVWITANVATASTRVPVLIRSGQRPIQTDGEWILDQEQLHPDGTVSSSTGTGGVGSAIDSLMEKIAPTAHAQANGGDSGDFLYDELWSEPRNLVGSPRSRVATSSAIGSVLPEGSNFEFSVPLYTLSGRGVPTGIALNYNSRIWSQHSSAVTFNAVNSWPYLGFTLSFGRIVTYGTSGSTKFVLIDLDGTRHYLGTGAIGTTNTYQTNDGSHITYVGNGTSGGTIYHNNGMKEGVGIHNNRLLVETVTDTNGNQLAICYKSLPQGGNNCSGVLNGYQAIDYIYDTLGRTIQFNYDTNNNLISIDVPGYGGTAQNPVTTTVVRFDYTTSSPSTSFSGLTVENVPSAGCYATLLSHVFFPATSTGQKFTYSAYGMISTVSLRNDMTYNSGTGAISDGNEKAYVNYNYPASASSLTAAPSFTQWTQSPGATTGGTSTWSFTSATGTNILYYTITNPDNTTLTLTRSTATGTDNGLLTKSEVKTSGGTSMAKSVIGYTTDGGGQPQVDNVVSYDDASNQTKVDFSYDSYGNVINTREYGFQQSGSWVVRRRTRNVYKTDTSYVNAYFRSLVSENDVYDGQLDTNDNNDVLVAKTTYTYDDYNAMAGMEDYRDPITGQLPPNPPGHLIGYDASYTLRGNVTGTTKWYDIANNLSYTWLRKIDVYGNSVTEQVACCNLQTQMASENYYWATPEQVIKGGAGGPQLIYTSNYDFNTLAINWGEDSNSQRTDYAYDAALRSSQVTYPSSKTKSTTYDDSAMTTTFTESYDGGDTQATITTTTEYDGWERVIKQTNVYGGQVNTNYDNMGRVTGVSNPFTAGGTPAYWTNYSYDALGRKTLTTLPDNQTLQSIYNGNSVTEIDQVNRKMQGLTDGLGRVVTVNEQDGSGNLTQATNHTYDVLGNLTQVNQGNQLRSYKYDALSRRTGEKIPEQGDPTQSNQMTTTLTYTDFNAIATKTDARGVVTTKSYDTLNRLVQVSYSTVSGVTTAPTVTYNYDTYNGITANGKLIRILVGSGYEERYSFDGQFRIASVVRSIGSRSYTTSYGYNDGDQLTLVTYPSGQLLYFGHDSHGMTSSLRDYPTGGNGNTYVSGHTHDVAGNLSSMTYGNGITEQYGYDPTRLQMTSHKAGTSSPYTNRMDLTYSYSASAGQMGVGTTNGNAGQLVSTSGTINGTTESAAYTYDNYSRLLTSNLTSNSSSAQRRFAYDRWGNRTGVWNATSGGSQIQSITMQTVSFPGTGTAPTNRISNVGGTSYSYDANGNVTNDGSHTYSYDSENRVVKVDGGSTATYGYDHQNRRYTTTVGSSVTQYVWNGSQVLAEHNGSTGALIVNYIYAGTRMIISGANYFLNDQLSARLILNAGGVVTGRQGHLPFGEDFAETGTQQKQHFTSYERDSQSATDYAVNRTYSFVTGRFNSSDPFQQQSGGTQTPQTFNRFAFAMNTPQGSIDPLGLFKAEPLPGDTCGTGGGGGGGSLPLGSCNIAVFHRLVEFSGGSPFPIPVIGTLIGARHGYIIFTNQLGLPIYFEAIRGKHLKLEATEALPLNLPLPDDNPLVDHSAGQMTGPQVCDWLSILEHDVDVVNAANLHWVILGPNSSSVLRYMLESLPDRSWYHLPKMVGYNVRLPGIE